MLVSMEREFILLVVVCMPCLIIIRKKSPCIVVCFILPGNVRPVIESKSAKDTLYGQYIEFGYQCNYVCCKNDGFPCTEIKDKCYNELVIPQENQVIPIFLLLIDISPLRALYEDFQREIPAQQPPDGFQPLEPSSGSFSFPTLVTRTHASSEGTHIKLKISQRENSLLVN